METRSLVDTVEKSNRDLSRSFPDSSFNRSLQLDEKKGRVDTYLEIAERVLRAAKRPMSPKSILDAAYRARVVPSHLFGKTQHKTLQARLSEDILKFRNNSKFFRTEPGIFFLSSLVADPEVDEKHKRPFAARRRTRDLMREPVLALNYSFFKSKINQGRQNWIELLRDAERENAIHFVDAKRPHKDFAVVWTFSVVRRSHYALSYRIGRYRDNRDCFANRRTVGFPGVIGIGDHDLFSMADYGATNSALDALLLDLDISREAFEQRHDLSHPVISNVLSFDDDLPVPTVLLVMQWQCPDWFEPTTRRLSLNDPLWLDCEVPPNNPDDFERWSIAVLDLLVEKQLKFRGQ